MSPLLTSPSNRISSRQRHALTAAAALVTFIAATATADVTWVGPTGVPSPYENPANWSNNAVPGGGDTLRIENGGIASVTAAGGNADFLYLGSNGGTGSVVQSDGTLAAGNDVQIGGDNIALTGGTGTYTLSGGAVTTGFDFVVGANGTGTLNMSGGSINTSRFFWMASANGAVGNATQTGGSIFTSNQFKMSDGVVTPTVPFNSTSTYTINGATASMNVADLAIGAKGTATFNLNDGAVTSRSHIRVGDDADHPNTNRDFRSQGTLNITGGTLNNLGPGTDNHILLGHVGRGTINLSAGAITTERFNLGQHGWNIGSYAAASTTEHARGVMNQTGGSVLVETALVPHPPQQHHQQRQRHRRLQPRTRHLQH
jgi:hypothetical protein